MNSTSLWNSYFVASEMDRDAHLLRFCSKKGRTSAPYSKKRPVKDGPDWLDKLRSRFYLSPTRANQTHCLFELHEYIVDMASTRVYPLSDPQGWQRKENIMEKARSMKSDLTTSFQFSFPTKEKKKTTKRITPKDPKDLSWIDHSN